MLKKYLRSTIIVTIQVILPVGLLLLLAPQLLQFNKGFAQASHFFVLHKLGFLFGHIIFYLALLWLWPKIIHLYINRKNHEVTPELIELALKARWYLLLAMAFFELMVWWR